MSRVRFLYHNGKRIGKYEFDEYVGETILNKEYIEALEDKVNDAASKLHELEKELEALRE